MFNRLLLPITAAVVLGFSIISIIRSQPVRAAADPPSAAPGSRFETRVAAVGLIEANSENISVGSPLPGIVGEVMVKTGDDIRKGTPLFRLDTRHLQAQLAEAKARQLSRMAAIGTANAQVLTAEAQKSEASINLGNAEKMSDGRGLSTEELTRRRTQMDLANANLTAAKAAVAAATADMEAAQATVGVVTTDLLRSTVMSPIAGTVLQVKLRPGEAVDASPTSQPLLLLGNTSPLHIRVDVDEHEAWRVKAGTSAEAQVRGNANLHTKLRFVRFEPYVIPKASLTGAASERVDTRVLQIIYEIGSNPLRLYPGQQMDVFIETDS